MGIYIKDIEMPTSCEKCPCKTADAFGGLGCQATGYIPLRKANQDRPDWCPLVPVPPHGDLIDRDALLDTATIHWSQTTNESCFPIDEIEYAPTIIEAEEKMK